MVRHIVWSMKVRPWETEDAAQEGFIGLIRAMREFDPTRADIRFSTFAYLCIMRRVISYTARGRNSGNRVLAIAIPISSFAGDVGPAKAISPEDTVVERESAGLLDRVLRCHLSSLEYLVAAMMAAGFSAREISQTTGLPAKSIDNARTRTRYKLARLLRQYGTLTNPDIPRARRRREDLYVRPPGEPIPLTGAVW
jgi:RNA polymerase sporulation-specific sigma factor